MDECKRPIVSVAFSILVAMNSKERHRHRESAILVRHIETTGTAELRLTLKAQAQQHHVIFEPEALYVKYHLHHDAMLRCLKPSLRPFEGSRADPVIGPCGGSESCDWLELLDHI
jgi:hypothetical protein